MAGEGLFEPHQPRSQRQAGSGSLLKAGFAAAGLLLTVAVVLNSSSSSSSSLKRELASTQLWEADDSVHHDPYYNIFEDGSPLLGNYGQSHKQWSSQVVRERVWQTLKDVRAMERHVREQNALNTKMKDQITTLQDDADNEKRVIRVLINKGMENVKDKIQLLKTAAAANVTDVKLMLEKIENEQSKKQAEQDKAIDLLEKRHKQLSDSTTKKFNLVDGQISRAESALAAAKTKVASERARVKQLILKKIQDDVGSLDSEMTGKLEAEKSDIRGLIDAGLRQLDGNISDYSLSTGIRVARLMNRVATLKKKQASSAKKQDKEITALEDAHKVLKAHTLDTLSDLRKKVEETRDKLTEAQKVLKAEQELKKKVEEKQLDKDMATLHSSVTQELSEAKAKVKARLDAGKAWVESAVSGVHSNLAGSVQKLEHALKNWETKADTASDQLQKELDATDASQKALAARMRTQVANMQGEMDDTESQLAEADNQLQAAVMAREESLQKKLKSKVTQLQAELRSLVNGAQTDLDSKLKAAQGEVSGEVQDVAKNSKDAISEIQSAVDKTSQEAKAVEEKQSGEIGDLSDEEQRLASETANHLAALKADLDKSEAAVKSAKLALLAKQDDVEAKVKEALEEKLRGLNASISMDLAQTRSDVQQKLSAGIAKASQEMSTATSSAQSIASSVSSQVSSLKASQDSTASGLKSRLKNLEDEHDSFESETQAALTKIQTTLSNTKSSLQDSDERMASSLAEKEGALRSSVAAALSTLRANITQEVSQEAMLLNQAHQALSAAMQAQQEAQGATIKNRQAKLQALAKDLASLQGTMSAIESMPGPPGPVGPPGPPGPPGAPATVPAI